MATVLPMDSFVVPGQAKDTHADQCVGADANLTQVAGIH
jgi:hypothetical protein